MPRISPITNNLWIVNNLICNDVGILYNFIEKDKYFEIYWFLTKQVVMTIFFEDDFYKWDKLTKALEALYGMDIGG